MITMSGFCRSISLTDQFQVRLTEQIQVFRKGPHPVCPKFDLLSGLLPGNVQHISFLHRKDAGTPAKAV